MPSFYIIPPRKTQFGEFGIAISGILGVKTNLPNNAPITDVGALQLDTNFSPVWTAQHIFNDNVYFNDLVYFSPEQRFNIIQLTIEGQDQGDLISYQGTSWTRWPRGQNNQILTTYNNNLLWTNQLNLGTTSITNLITDSLQIDSLNGVLRANSGIVSGNAIINDLYDVNINNPSLQQYLKWNGTSWINANIPLPDRSLVIRFFNGYTPRDPDDLGPNNAEIAIVPFEPSTGSDVLVFDVSRIILQIQTTAISGTSSVRIQRLASNLVNWPDPNDPSADILVSLTMNLGNTEVFKNKFSSPPLNIQISSGQKLRAIVDSIGIGANYWILQLEASSGSLYTTDEGVVPISRGGTGRSTAGSPNTLLTVSGSGEKLIYKSLVAGTNVTITNVPITLNGEEIGGNIVIDSTGGGGGSGNVNPGAEGQIAYYASNASAVSPVPNLFWNNTTKGLNLSAVPASYSTSTISLLIGNNTLNNGSANGTIIGLNLPLNPNFTGNFADFQINNVSKFTIASDGSVVINSNVASNNSNSGALIVAGGAGIAGSLNLGNPLASNSGGTGYASYLDNQILIGDTATATLKKKTLQNGTRISIVSTPTTVTLDAIGSGVAIGINPPNNPSEGDLWWKSDTGSLKIYYKDTNNDSYWVDSFSPGNIAALNLQSANMIIKSGFVPENPGADFTELVVPYSTLDGKTAVTFKVRRLYVRVNSSGDESIIRFEKSTTSGVFTPIQIGEVTLPLNAFESSNTTSFVNSTVTSGDKIRINFVQLGSANHFTCGMEISE